MLSNINDRKLLNKCYYRVSYNGIGVYEAFKNEVINKYPNGWEIWKKFKNSKHVNWLPLPKINYESGCYSYFTTVGYLKFKKETLPLIEEYLDKSKIKTEIVTNLSGKIVYLDKYQIVIKL